MHHPVCACIGGKEEKTRMLATQLLLSRGADVNARDDSGRTAFSYACEMHCNDVVQLLIRNNVDPDVPDSGGQSLCRASILSLPLTTSVIILIVLLRQKTAHTSYS